MEVVDHLRVASAALDAALLVDSPLAGVEVAELIRLNRLLIAKAESLGLRLTFTADKAGVARREGSASTAAFVAKTTGVSLAQAAREVKLDHDLQRVAPATREALVSPGMSKDKMTTLATALNKLPKTLPAADKQRVEDDLVEKAARLSLEDFRRAANRALEVIDAVWADRAQGEELA
ncbi:MAG: hypothetical protein JWP10_1240, partial [Nocardioidaceae bacterium]|nr:hypothetical protein [Nocardioidaceae bacterium]